MYFLITAWSRVQVLAGPPNKKNPNLFPVGEGFGFFIFLGELNQGTNHKIHKPEAQSRNYLKPDKR